MRRSWLVALFALSGCGTHYRAAAPTASPSLRPAGSQRNPSPGILRNVHFASTPVVLLDTSCPDKDKRKCDAATYTVYARLDRGIPRHQPRVRWATFVIADSRWEDPIKHPRLATTCFIQSLYSDDPKADHVPTKPGGRVRLQLQVFDSGSDSAVPIGAISTAAQVRRADSYPPGTSRTARHAVGC
jgi:hypothetical protein